MSGRKSAGFTLIELMLAIGILALVLAMLTASFSAVAHSKEHAESRLYANAAGRTIIWQLSNEIRDTVGGPTDQLHTLLIGQGHVQNGSPLDTLTLATYGAGHHRAIFGYGPEDIVTYTAQPNPQHPGWFLLTRTQQSALLRPGATSFRPEPIVLAGNVLALHLRYFDGNIWNESWNSQVAQNNASLLPVAVSIDLRLAAPGGQPMDFSTQVTLPMGVMGQLQPQ
jgi:prepilin-type N-terminal cleavage/methylation domain-containing protein